MAALIWCPYPSKKEARNAAKRLLEKRLIACANIVDCVESVFAFEGEIKTAQEVAALFKTTEARMDDAILLIKDVHPYELPAIIGWRCDSSAPETLLWLSRTIESFS